jgi:hypothetical protein
MGVFAIGVNEWLADWPASRVLADGLATAFKIP